MQVDQGGELGCSHLVQMGLHKMVWLKISTTYLARWCVAYCTHVNKAHNTGPMPWLTASTTVTISVIRCTPYVRHLMRPSLVSNLTSADNAFLVVNYVPENQVVTDLKINICYCSCRCYVIVIILLSCCSVVDDVLLLTIQIHQ